MNISYHPINEKEINEWYCDLKFESILNQVYYEIVKNGRRFNLNDEELKSYVEIMKMSAVNAQSKANFDEAHGYNVALVQGLFRKYFFLKDFSFSKLIEEKSYFERYTKSWEEITLNKIEQKINNSISGEKSGGVFIPFNKVVELLQDLRVKGSVQDDLNNYFGDHIELFVSVLEFAKSNNLGLLEASGIISKEILNAENEVNEIVINNCDEASLRFVPVKKELENKAPKAEVPVVAQIAENVVEKKDEKKSLWKKLFG